MYRLFLGILATIMFLGAGCAPGRFDQPLAEPRQEPAPSVSQMNAPPRVVLPIAEYVERRTFKAFGEYIEDRFRGYHVGDDIEYADTVEEVPVVAITDGTVQHVGRASGYGGVMVIAHPARDSHMNAIYGHLDLASTNLQVGDAVTRGQFLANLGDHESVETDGERKHLHFGLYRGGEVRLDGYVREAGALERWINPQDFFIEQGVRLQNPARTYDPSRDLGGNVFHTRFTIPAGWEAEYVPSIEALNLFMLSGNGSARNRSQIFIRYFDAAEFLTLRTVTIHNTEEVTVGAGNYEARRYDIEKKSGVPSFPDQPSWRNERHVVTDFRDKTGFTRYYVIATRPDLDPSLYESILASMTIVP